MDSTEVLLSPSPRPLPACPAAALPQAPREALQSTLLGLTAAAATLALGVGPALAEPKLPPLDTGG